MVLPYPTLSEAGKRAAGEFYTPRLLSPFTKRLIGWLKRLPLSVDGRGPASRTGKAGT